MGRPWAALAVLAAAVPAEAAPREAAPREARPRAGVGRRCGGGNWTGAATCPSGLFCNHTNAFWWDCQAEKRGVGQRCGGKGFEGSTECPDELVCLRKDEFWSDCQTKAAAEKAKKAAKAASKPLDVAGLNARFAQGKPGGDLASAGILIHQFHNGMDGDWKAWMPCPATCFGGPCWCHSFADRFSASLLNARLLDDKGRVGMYSTSNAGFIFAPQYMQTRCLYPADGGSESKSCKPGLQGCVPGCGSKWCAFNPAQPNNMDTSCAWSPKDLWRVLTLQETANSRYNEVVVDAQAVVDNLPHSIAAVFYVKGSPAAKEARRVHDDFLAAFGEEAKATLLLEMDTRSPQAPFRDVGAPVPTFEMRQAYEEHGGAAAPPARPTSLSAAAASTAPMVGLLLVAAMPAVAVAWASVRASGRRARASRADFGALLDEEDPNASQQSQVDGPPPPDGP